MKRKPAEGLGVLLELGGKKPPSSDEHDDAPDADEDSLPMDYLAAYKAYKADPNPQTMWDMIETCAAAGRKESDKGSY